METLVDTDGDLATTTPALRLQNITAGYGDTIILRDLSLEVPTGHVVAMLGPNGVGKTTVLRTIAGLLQPKAGTVEVNGLDVTKLPPHDRAKNGLCLVPEGGGVFRSLSVAENLRLQLPPWAERGASIDPAIEAFPALGKRLHQRAGSMSGGEQKMLALARAYLCSPSIVLLDEVSLGLAPLLVSAVFDTIRDLAALGVTLVVVEQYVNRALDVADKIVLLEEGAVAFDGPRSALDKESLVSHYLGVDEAAEADAGIPADERTSNAVAWSDGHQAE
jgi:branched-chain amino acid transport system ATP-binding protein